LNPVRALLPLLLALGAAGARADADDTINLSAGLVRHHDSNLFRVADGVDLAPLVGNRQRGDTLTTARLGIDFRKAWSLQELEAAYEHVDTRYATYDHLDHAVDNLRLRWRWSLTPRLTGNLGHSRDESLVGFGDYTGYGSRNTRITVATRLDADWHAGGSWHLRAGIERRTSRNTRSFTQDEGARTDSGEAGIRYQFRSGNRLEAIVRHGRGAYLRTLDPLAQLDAGFTERRHELRARRALGGKSTLEATLGHVARRHDNFASRDYAGAVGSARWNWSPTGKLDLALAWKSELAAYTDATASYARQESLALSPSWQITHKIRLGLVLDRKWHDYRAAVVPLVPHRADRLDSARLEAEWRPWRNVQVGGYLASDRRHSSLAPLRHDTRMAGATLRLDY